MPKLEGYKVYIIEFETGEKLILPIASLVGIDLSYRYLHRAIMTKIDMRGIVLQYANLRNAILDGSNMSNANLKMRI